MNTDEYRTDSIIYSEEQEEKNCDAKQEINLADTFC